MDFCGFGWFCRVKCEEKNVVDQFFQFFLDVFHRAYLYLKDVFSKVLEV